jgi:serine protease inhibitor
MHTTSQRRGLAILLVVVLAGCGSTPASPSGVAATPSPSVGASISRSIPPASPAATPEALKPGAVIVTVSDRLRVRSEPRVSDDSIMYDPVLPLGTELFVLDGPVSGSGFTWYKVAPVSFAGLSGPGSGWVASAGKDGEPWIAAATGPTADLALAIAPVPRASADSADAKRASTSINAFGLDLLRALLADEDLDLGDKNVVFSPTSIELALAMARAGAKGETATEMDRVLHMRGWEELASGLNSLDQELASRDAKWTDGEGAKELTLRLANAPFAQRGWTIEPAYLDEIATAFGAGLRLVDYVGDLAAARATINGWVSDRTAERIPELLGPLDLTADTRLTLVNAIYLKAQWDVWFQERQTKPAAFTRLDGSQVNVPTMERWGGTELPYAKGAGWQATELRYLAPRGDSPRLAMLLVLPDEIRAFEAGLTAEKLDGITAAITKERQQLQDGIDCPGVPPDQQDAGCYPYALTLFMPKFSTETRAKLNDVLQGLGMPLAFDARRADFSGINPRDPVYIGFVIHQANIDVDEKGTEAAAATAVGMDVGGGPSAVKEIALRLERPFLYFVRDVETGAILFMGRVTDPSVPKGN